MTSAADNDAVSRAFIAEATNNLDATNIDAYKDPGYTVHRSGFRNLHELTGRAIADPADPDPLAGFRALHRAFEGWNAQVTESVAAGDLVATRMEVTGRHVGDFLGIPASGAPIRISEIGIRRFRDGRMVEGWWMADEIGLLRQIGVDISALLRT